MRDVHALPEVLVFIHAIQQNAAYTIRPASIDASTRRWVHTRVNQIRPVPNVSGRAAFQDSVGRTDCQTMFPRGFLE